jgi:hypothetical protein
LTGGLDQRDADGRAPEARRHSVAEQSRSSIQTLQQVELALGSEDAMSIVMERLVALRDRG